MKEVAKEKLLMHNMSKYLNSEIDLMLNLDHPNIIKLFFYFEDEEKVYLILELAKSGHLYRKLRLKGKLSEVEAMSVR